MSAPAEAGRREGMRLEPKAGLVATSATLEVAFEVEVDGEAIAAYEGGDGRRQLAKVTGSRSAIGTQGLSGSHPKGAVRAMRLQLDQER